ncbi:MAG: DNA (cytosine-5-)-methyltransferase [Chloroflexi bacterium]|nr:DNA (cytosine-5-)-methyltransferase [Chloroflexota bacterium]
MTDISHETLEVLRQKSFAEFFAGIGLVRAGLERQAWSVALANDIDPIKHEMYKGHFTDAEKHFLLNDIHNLDVTTMPPVTLATASFPCKDLSIAGSRGGLNGTSSSAFWGFIQVLERWNQHRPPLVMLENVVGFLNANNGKDFEQALLALNNLGYRVDAFILDAVNFVPQSRERLFVIGLAENIFPTKSPKEAIFGLQSNVRPSSIVSFILKHPQMRWNIRQLPSPSKCEQSLDDIVDDPPENDPIWWSHARAEYLLNQMSSRHRMIADQMITGNRWSYGTVFRRMRKGKSTAELRTDGIAGCLRTPSGGSAKQIIFKAGYGQYFARLLTPREAARLMGIGEYNITVPFDQALLGFGDAVCVPVIEWIAKNYLDVVIEDRIGHITQEAVLTGVEW